LLCVTYAFPKAPASWLRVLAVPYGWSFGASWNQLCLAWDSPGLSSQRSLLQPPIVNTLPQTLSTYGQHNLDYFQWLHKIVYFCRKRYLSMAVNKSNKWMLSNYFSWYRKWL